MNWDSPYTEFEFILETATTTKSDYVPDDWPEAEGELPPSLEYLLGRFIQAIQGASGILKNDYQNVMLWYETMRQALVTYIKPHTWPGRTRITLEKPRAGISTSMSKRRLIISTTLD